MLDPRTGDFSISSWVYTEAPVLDTLGDVVSKFDPAARRGFTLSLYSTSGGYNGQGSDRHVAFGIDNARTGDAAPLKIGFGEFDYFSGKIREVRLYHRALSGSEIAKLASRVRGDFR